MRNEMQENVLE